MGCCPRGRRYRIYKTTQTPLFPCEVTTGLPQGSPISPIYFTVYVAEIHEVEKQAEWCRGIPFVDDVTCLAEGANLNEESFHCPCMYIFPLSSSFLCSFLCSTSSGKGAGELEIYWGGSYLGFLQ